MLTPPSTAWTVLSRLKQKNGGYISGAELAADLSITRTAVWKSIQALAARGYTIESHPRLGYRLASSPDLLLPEEILPALSTRWLGRHYVHLLETESTNLHGLALALQNAPDGTVVLAEHQTAGRGRLRRTWDSPKGTGIYLSMILRPSLCSNQAPQIPLVVALALTRFLSSTYGLPALIKWPNDILIEGRKVSGILAEMQLDQDEIRFLVVGVGINVNQTQTDFSGQFRYPPTSLAIQLERTLSRRDILVGFLTEAESTFDRFAADGFPTFLQEFEARSAIVGEDVTVQTGSRSVSGHVRGFTTEGALRLLPHGARDEEIIWVGDVIRVAGEFLERGSNS